MPIESYIMIKTIFKRLFLLLTVTAAVGVGSAQAQTCRICSGVSSTGCKNYIEVFEYDYVDTKPEYPGGNCCFVKFINDNRRYPAEAYRKGIEGRVMCSFVVNTDGSISNITILKSVEPSLNREAIRVFSKMPAWSPGKLNGQAVPVRVIRCIPFRK